MPAGPMPLGFLYFTGIKALGYSIAAYQLKSGYGLKEQTKPSVPIVGLVRTGIGIAAGISYWGLWWVASSFFDGAFRSEAVFLGLWYGLLLPIRGAEWALVIWIFFDKKLERPRLWKYVGLGVAWSYLLDAIGVFAAFVLPGGIWVC